MTTPLVSSTLNLKGFLVLKAPQLIAKAFHFSNFTYLLANKAP